MNIGKNYFYACIVAATFLMVSDAAASGLVFQGQNAALFPGANPSDTTMLMNSVPKPAAAASSSQSSAISASALVLQSIEAQISSKVYNDIFGVGARASGTDLLGDGSSISWAPATDGSGRIVVTIVSPNGTSTTFQVY